jgi:glucose-1-phosphate thymidylyltransferase
MIYYPLQTLVDAGIKDILVISGQTHSVHFENLLGTGKEFGVNISYALQEKAGGIAQALGLAEGFAAGDDVFVILGDNITDSIIALRDFNGGARVYLKEVEDPRSFGVAVLDKDKKIVHIQEKPEKPRSNLAVTGLYIYDNKVFDIIKTLNPSARGELEITDVNNDYITRGGMDYRVIDGFWEDAGDFEGLYKASEIIRSKNVQSDK